MSTAARNHKRLKRKTPSLQHAEMELAEARELLAIAGERVALAEDRLRFANERKQTVETHLAVARDLADAARRLSENAARLYRVCDSSSLGFGKVLRAEMISLCDKANAIRAEADAIAMRATGHATMLDYQKLTEAHAGDLESKRLSYEAAVRMNATELLELAEQHLERAHDRVRRAVDRARRAQGRVDRLQDDAPPAT